MGASYDVQMGQLFSHNADGWYASYENRLEGIEARIRRVQGQQQKRKQAAKKVEKVIIAVGTVLQLATLCIVWWLNRQPPGTLSATEHTLLALPFLAVPVVFGSAYWMTSKVVELMALRDKARVRKLEAAKEKMVGELKRITQFDTVQKLLDKYDPETRKERDRMKSMELRLKALSQQQPGASRGGARQRGDSSPLPARSQSTIAGVVSGAGRTVLPVLDKVASIVGNLPPEQQELERMRIQLGRTAAERDALRDRVQQLESYLCQLQQASAAEAGAEPEPDGLDAAGCGGASAIEEQPPFAGIQPDTEPHLIEHADENGEQPDGDQAEAEAADDDEGSAAGVRPGAEAVEQLLLEDAEKDTAVGLRGRRRQPAAPAQCAGGEGSVGAREKKDR